MKVNLRREKNALNANKPIWTYFTKITRNFKRFRSRISSDLLIWGGEWRLVWGYFVDNLSDADNLAFIIQYRHTQYVVSAIASLLVDIFVKAWILYSHQHSTTLPRVSDTWPPFPQTDIIGAMVIVWRVRGKIIRSVLCNIVCNNCAQCNAHTYEQT